MDTHNDKELKTLLRQKFDDYEVELPADDWVVFSRKLAEKQPKRHRFVWYYVTAAASIIGIFFIGITYLAKDDRSSSALLLPIAQNNAHVATKTIISVPKSHVLAKITRSKNTSTVTNPTSASNSPNASAQVNANVPSTVSAGEEVETSLNNAQTTTTNVSSTPQEVKAPIAQNANLGQNTLDTTGYITHNVPQYTELPPLPSVADEQDGKTSSPKQKNSINWLAGNFQSNTGLSGGNSNLLSDGSLGSQLYNRVSKASSTSSGSTTPTYVPFTGNETYYLPLTFGLTAGLKLAPRWELQSGIVYTLLVTTGDVQSSSSIRATGRISQNYIGIPVDIAYIFFQNASLSFYVSGGGRIEKGVSLVQTIYTYDSQNNPTERESDNYSINGIQLSLDASVGASYRLYRSLHLYVETGGAWYIPGNQPESSRTEYPVNFALKTGLRFSLSK
jgi:hypothetical protein